MKTFEESYTAWIDGQLHGAELSGFEQELTRRAAQGEAATDKADTLRLRGLLQDHYQAPALTNPDFFSHQLRERIDAERKASSRGRENSRNAEPAIFAWGLVRLLGIGAASLFAAAAIYYGMMPPRTGFTPDLTLARNTASGRTTAGTDPQIAVASSPTPVPPAVVPAGNRDADGPVQMVRAAPTPVPFDLSTDDKARTPEQTKQPTTVAPLHYNQPKVNVLWLNGLEYLPTVSEDAGTPSAVDTSASPAPSASAAP